MYVFRISLLAILALVFLLLSSCEKSEIIDCGIDPETEHKENNESNLFGIWEWRFVSCAWNPQDANGEEFSGLSVQFRPDYTLSVIENGEEITYCDWSIEHSLNSHKLNLTEAIPQLEGFLSHNGETMALDARESDGCRNVWEKVAATF